MRVCFAVAVSVLASPAFATDYDCTFRPGGKPEIRIAFTDEDIVWSKAKMTMNGETVAVDTHRGRGGRTFVDTRESPTIRTVTVAFRLAPSEHSDYQAAGRSWPALYSMHSVGSDGLAAEQVEGTCAIRK